MTNRWFLVGVMLLASLLVVGCGVWVATEDYEAVVAERDAVLAERDAAQTKVASLQSDLDKVQSQIETIESDLSKAQSQVGTLQSKVTAAEGQYTTFKSDLNTSWTLLQRKLIAWAAISEYLNSASWTDAGLMSSQEFMDYAGFFMVNMGSYASAVGDAELIQTWYDLLSYATQGKEAEVLVSFKALADRIGNLVGADIEALDAKLSNKSVPKTYIDAPESVIANAGEEFTVLIEVKHLNSPVVDIVSQGFSPDCPKIHIETAGLPMGLVYRDKSAEILMQSSDTDILGIGIPRPPTITISAPELSPDGRVCLGMTVSVPFQFKALNKGKTEVVITLKLLTGEEERVEQKVIEVTIE